MPVTITGSKYGDLTLSSAGTTTVSITTNSFASGDFNYTTPRLAALYTSGGAFKGFAHIRRMVATWQIELEAPFINPSNGIQVTQETGDILQVSNNWAECVTTGIAMSDVFVTVSDYVTFGTDGNQNSVCFYDEGKYVSFTFSPVAASAFKIAGGLVVQGHLADYSAKKTYNGCTWRINGDSVASFSIVSATSTSAKFLFFGGNMHNYSASPNYGYIAGVNGWAYTDFQKLLIMGTTVIDLDMFAGDGGIDFANPQDHVVDSCVMVTSRVQYSILMRWANGIANGNTFKIANYSDKPLSIFGGDVSGTEVGSAADGRVIVSDVGNGNALWRRGVNDGPMRTMKCKNIISTDKRAMADLAAEGTNCTLNFFYRDTYTNLKAATTGIICRDGDATVVDSVIGTGTSWAPEIQHDSWTGYARNSGYPNGPWTYSFKAYGYNPVSGAIVAGTYDLGSSGVADNVILGGAIIQVADTSVTLSPSAANALTSLPTLDDVYDRAIAWSVADISAARYPTLDTYMVSSNGKSLDFGNRNLVVDATAGSVFSVNTGNDTVTIKATTLSAGTKFTKLVTTGNVSFINGAVPSATLPYASVSGTNVPVTAPNLISGTRVQIYNTTNSTQLENTIIGSGGYAGRFTWTSDAAIRLRATYCVGAVAKEEVESISTLTNSGTSFLATQINDSIYNTAGISGSTCTEFTADYPNVQIDINDPDGVTYVQRIHAWWMYNVTTSGGISDFFGGFVAEDAVNFKVVTNTVNLRLNNKNSLPVIVAGGRIYRDDVTTIIAATSGSIHMDPNKVYAIETGPGVVPADITAIASATKTRMEETGSKLTKTETRSRLIPGTL